jgi:hypothetical protein
MVISDGKLYESFEELGNHMLSRLPKKRQPVKWWRGWKLCKMHHTDLRSKTFWQRVKVWLPHIHKSRSWVGYLFLHIYLCNRWCLLFVCGHYEFKERG